MREGVYLVTYNESLGAGYFRIGLETGWKEFTPGQFGMLEVPRCNGVLLRRPFSFARQIDGTTEILYKVVGKGTKALSQVALGTSLGLLGPLGRGFSWKSGDQGGVGVAGGYGVAPFLELAKQLNQSGGRLRLFYGASSKEDLLFLKELNELNVKLYTSTVDGSVGHRGLITEALHLECNGTLPTRLWSCGPMGLLRAVALWAEAKKIPCEVSVEEAMGCGTGICLGCVVPDRSGHLIRACKEGPVFSGEVLQW